MEFLRNTALTLCVTAAAAGIISFLFPKRGMNSAMEFALRLVLLGSICFSLGGTDFEELLSFPESEYSGAVSGSLSGELDTQILETFAGNIEAEVGEILKQYGILSAETQVSVHISDEEVISISSIQITVREAIPETAVLKVKDAFGVLPEVVS